MKLLVKFLFLACVVVATAKPLSLTEEEIQAVIAELAGKCKAQEGASDADVQDAIAHKPPASHQAQCFHACMMENFGAMRDGKLSAEGSAKLAEMSGDPVKIKNSQAVVKECSGVGSGDRCDNVLEIMQCVEKVAAELGFDPTKDLH